jgi:regulator of PEP synthase PpsR (kinase-PPPase family)
LTALPEASILPETLFPGATREPAVSAAELRTIYLLSDGTCRTCEQVVQAVLVQFKDAQVRIVRKPNVRRPETVSNLIAQAAAERALVFYTLVYDKARAAIEAAAREHMVPIVDLLGPVLASLYDLFQTKSRAKPGILYQANKDYFDRIDAVDYTLHHDDGCRIHEVGEADVSRACKSTTCFYLAYSGIRAANVPLFPDTPPPDPLFDIDQRRIVGLTVNPYRLQSVRDARVQAWSLDPNSEYADRIHIAREIRAVNEQMAKYGWQVLDVSYKAIEEIARAVVQTLGDGGIDVRRHVQRGT